MHRTEAEGRAVAKPSVPAAVNSPGYFQSGTVVDYGMMNSIMDEIARAVEAAGITLDRDEDGQLFAAIQAGLVSDTVDIFQGESSTLHTRGIAVSEKCGVEGDWSFVAASKYGNAVGNYAAILASNLADADTGVSGNGSALLGCGGDGNTAISASNAVALAAFNPDISTDFGSILSGGNNEIGANAGSSAIVASDDSKVRSANGGTTPNNIVLLASSFCDFDLGANGTAQRRYAVAGGYHLTTLSAPSWRIESNGGTMRSTAAHTTSGLDYAEMFENKDKKEIPMGSFVTRRGKKASLGGSGDRVLGIVSASPTVIGGDDGIAWQGRVLRDDWGAVRYEDVTETTWEADQNDLKAYREAQRALRAEAFLILASSQDEDQKKKSLTTIREKRQALKEPEKKRVERPMTQVMLNPAYVPGRPQVSRKDRPAEWTCVGLTGQIRCRVDATVKVDDFVVCGTGGVGTSAKAPHGRPVECMEIVVPFDPAKGYAVALCLVG